MHNHQNNQKCNSIYNIFTTFNPSPFFQRIKPLRSRYHIPTIPNLRITNINPRNIILILLINILFILSNKPRIITCPIYPTNRYIISRIQRRCLHIYT